MRVRGSLVLGVLVAAGAALCAPAHAVLLGVRDYGTVRINPATGAFVEQGYLDIESVTFTGADGKISAAPGYDQGFGMFVKYRGEGQQQPGNPYLQPLNGAYTKQHFDVYSYSISASKTGKPVTFGFSADHSPALLGLDMAKATLVSSGDLTAGTGKVGSQPSATGFSISASLHYVLQKAAFSAAALGAQATAAVPVGLGSAVFADPKAVPQFFSDATGTGFSIAQVGLLNVSGTAARSGQLTAAFSEFGGGQPVPEPASLALLGCGLLGLGLSRGRGLRRGA